MWFVFYILCKVLLFFFLGRICPSLSQHLSIFLCIMIHTCLCWSQIPDIFMGFWIVLWIYFSNIFCEQYYYLFISENIKNVWLAKNPPPPQAKVSLFDGGFIIKLVIVIDTILVPDKKSPIFHLVASLVVGSCGTMTGLPLANIGHASKGCETQEIIGNPSMLKHPISQPYGTIIHTPYVSVVTVNCTSPHSTLHHKQYIQYLQYIQYS